MTKHQIDPRQCSDSDLTRHLLAARGTQWMRGNRGDPYALILRAQGIDPHFLYRGMRGQPVLRQAESDVWVVADHAAGAQILADERLAPAAPGGGRRRRPRVFGIDSSSTLKHVLSVDDSLLALDHEERRRLTELVGPALGVAGLERWHGPVREEFTAALDAAGDSFDLVNDVLRPGVAAVLDRMLGLGPERRTRLQALGPDLSPVLDALLCPPTLNGARRLVASVDALRELLDEVVAERVGEDADGGAERDLLAALRAVAGEQDTVTALMLAAGVGSEVAVTLTGNAVLALLDHPDQWELLRGDPGAAGDAVEETLRFEPPVRLDSRIAGQRMEIAGQEIGKGDQVVVLVDAANRDPGLLSGAEEFRLGRPGRADHLSLADGSHLALLAPMVRLLATGALASLAAAPGAALLRRDGDVVHRMRTPVTRSIARCPLTRPGVTPR
ncbi:P450-derived glycosyltransferase activator [Streptomyces spiramenti]|uniref:P450-derived glycosyltransferase activator n=1 Tax=Streptomyces spiramenti TaxID=2720606 RepID=A0ABX1AHJ0_9ACTN|nr:P450-derived glycosyltransferase activator [Streptomyces spiramenti]NJP64828.1 P450-derived glycosyltransferase activator [Streptomyces spiramenti]